MVNYEAYIDGLINKDEQAFADIYNATKQSVYAIIIAIVRDSETANDLMQDTYITMIEKIHQYKCGKNLLTWLLVIARNKAIDYYRKNKNTILINLENADTILPISEPQGERKILVEEMLNLLTDNERQVFLLRIMQDLPHREIAKIMKIPLGTSLWLYQKALRKINKVKGSDLHETK